MSAIGSACVEGACHTRGMKHKASDEVSDPNDKTNIIVGDVASFGIGATPARLSYSLPAATAPCVTRAFLSGPRPLPPALRTKVQGEHTLHGGDGGCTAAAMVNLGVWGTKAEAITCLNAQITPMHKELQRRWGEECEESEAGIRGEQWHEEAIKRALITQGYHFHTVVVNPAHAKVVDLRETLKDGAFFVIGVTNNCWYKGGKKQRLKYPQSPANAPALDQNSWAHSIAIVDGFMHDHYVTEDISSLWLQSDNQPNPAKGYMRSIRKVWRVTRCENPNGVCRGACTGATAHNQSPVISDNIAKLLKSFGTYNKTTIRQIEDGKRRQFEEPSEMIAALFRIFGVR